MTHTTQIPQHKIATVWLSDATGNYHWSIVERGDVIAFGEAPDHTIADRLINALRACCRTTETVEVSAPLEVHHRLAVSNLRSIFADAHIDS